MVRIPKTRQAFEYSTSRQQCSLGPCVQTIAGIQWVECSAFQSTAARRRREV